MKNQIWVTASAVLALSGCDAISVVPSNSNSSGIVSAEDAKKLKNNLQCSQSARVMVATTNEALQSGRIAELVGDPARRGYAVITAEHDFSNLQLLNKYSESGSEEVGNILEAAGNDLKSQFSSEGDKGLQFDFLQKFLDKNCHSPELIAENLDAIMKDQSLKSEYDRLFEQALATNP